MIQIETEAITLKAQLIALDEQCARIMKFKKVHWFMGKLCVQYESDVANNNIPWSPTTDARHAMEIMRKYHLSLKPYAVDGWCWCCYSEHTEAYDTDPLVAICKSLVAHEKLG